MTPKQKNIVVILVMINFLVFGVLCLFGFGIIAQQQASVRAESTAIAFERTQAAYSPTPMPTNTATPTPTPTPSVTRTATRTAIATPTVQSTSTSPAPTIVHNLEYEQLQSCWNSGGTRILLDECMNSAKGKRVHWVAEVSNVYSDGSVSIDVNSSQCLLCLVWLEGLPLSTARTLQRGQIIEFDGQITLADAGILAFSCHVKWLAFTKK